MRVAAVSTMVTKVDPGLDYATMPQERRHHAPAPTLNLGLRRGALGGSLGSIGRPLWKVIPCKPLSTVLTAARGTYPSWPGPRKASGSTNMARVNTTSSWEPSILGYCAYFWDIVLPVSFIVCAICSCVAMFCSLWLLFVLCCCILQFCVLVCAVCCLLSCLFLSVYVTLHSCLTRDHVLVCVLLPDIVYHIFQCIAFVQPSCVVYVFCCPHLCMPSNCMPSCCILCSVMHTVYIAIWIFSIINILCL